MLLQSLSNIAELCARHGIRRAVICPGSRSAALTLAFARHPDFTCFSIPDERAAGYIALGMAQQLSEPVVLICTSGTAAYNFAPAVAEAFFQNIPLIVLTADRPTEWIGQQDGQAIFQRDIYGKHTKFSAELPADYLHPDSKWFINRTVNQAINTSKSNPCGPVHINVPIREPFYPDENEEITYEEVRVIKNLNLNAIITDFDIIHERITSKVLIAVGQLQSDSIDYNNIEYFSNQFSIPVVGEVLSNTSQYGLNALDAMFIRPTKAMQPDVLITFGRSFISKNFKNFIKKYPPNYHYHVSESENIVDTFQTVTHHARTSPRHFVFEYQERHITWGLKTNKRFLNLYKKSNSIAEQRVATFLNDRSDFYEFVVLKIIMDALPNDCILHLANSMSVRYANFIGVRNPSIQVDCNRGTSGIDGCLSTAVGAALATDKLVFLVIGDIAFFYDRNALWHQHLPDNLRIILLNNSGGTIFRMIDGPSRQPELSTFFETTHSTTAASFSDILTYFSVENYENLTATIPKFVAQEGGRMLIEIVSDPEKNQKFFKEFKGAMAK